jgi:signal transduction histidine kinase
LKKVFCIQLLLSIVFFNTIIQTTAQLTPAIDSAKKVINKKGLDKSTYISTCFFIADNYMDEGKYDSTQIWLNKIYEKIPAKLNSVENYFLISRQAEVYYYNNLQQLGLQESLRGVAMAKVLNDSFLLVDAYNFSGLFFIGVDSLKAATNYLLNGIKYLKQPPYIEKYTGLAKPHHLYGNLAEAYFKLKQWDRAIYFCNLSLVGAQKIKMNRGVAIAYISLGEAYFGKKILDSAIQNFTKSFDIALQNNYDDAALLCKSGLAKCFFENKNTTNAILQLKEGRLLLQQNENINSFFAIRFLNTAIDINKKLNENSEVMACSNLKRKIQEQSTAKENAQIKTILNASIVNEKRLLSLEVQDVKQKEKIYTITVLLLLILIVLGIIGFFFYRNYKNRKIEIVHLKQKISQDLHDDIGATLSSIHIYSDLAQRNIDGNVDKTKQLLDKINQESKNVMENMNDIVWSMKNTDANSIHLEYKIRNEIAKILEFKNINLQFNIDADVELKIKNITAKKNVLLIIKEAFNNIAKYSQATTANITMNCSYANFVLTIKDNGIGFLNKDIQTGNGLKNIAARCNELKGKLDINTNNNGTTLQLTIPQSSIAM